MDILKDSSASSSVLSYGLKIPADGNGAEFSSTVDVSSLEVLEPSQVAKKIADGLRSNSPSAELIGTAVESFLKMEASFKLIMMVLTYTLQWKMERLLYLVVKKI